MYVEELIVDGFKSYAARTVISGWDPEFTAITGLNGSGKSNVLDAICFVLGISNLSHVRAQNLQDLVYKRGQAGISKASVTIVFNNANKAASPVGFDQYDQITVTRQIVIGGRNKYLINGHIAQNQAIANLFQSVQLNINNPHFLIMQGRITKVLNMKPPEILAMIEEAAGTRMFEEKKDKALKTIAKKDQKLDEINQLMENDIAPKLDKLKQEKSDFMRFQKIETEVERLRRLMIAYDFVKSQEKLDQSENDYETKKIRIDELQSASADLERSIQEAHIHLEKIAKSQEKELKKGGKYQELQNAVKELANQLTRLSTQYDLKAKNMQEEEVSEKTLTQNLKQLSASLDAATARFNELDAAYQARKKSVDKEADETRKMEEFLQTLSTGIAADEGKDNGYVDQIEGAKREKSEALTAIEQAKDRIAFLNAQLKSKQSSAKQAEKENASQMKEFDNLKNEIEQLKVERMEMDYHPDREQLLKQEFFENKNALSSLREQIEMLCGQLSNLDFQYADPYPGFDRNKVKGLVAKLVEIDPSRINFTNALQVCAEGRLYFVVVEDNKVGTDLLKGGKLKRKYTIVPLKQIVTPNIPQNRIDAAKALAPGKVEYALSLVGYPREVEAAMKFVFGSTFICADAASAKAVAYHPDIKMRAITVDGDVFEPGATITGGSAPNSSNILAKLHTLRSMQHEYASVERQFNEAKAKYEAYQQMAQRVLNVEAMLRKKEYELKSLEKVLATSASGQLLAEIAKMKDELEELEKKIVECTEIQKSMDKKVKELEKDMKEFESNKDGKLKKIEADVAKAKKNLVKITAALKEDHKALLIAQQEKESIESEVADIKGQLEVTSSGLGTMRSESKQMEAELKTLKNQHDDVNEELQEHTRKFAKYNSEVKEMEQKKKSEQAQLDEIQIEIKRLSHEITRFQRDRSSAEETVQKMLREHDWINDQKELFGKPNTAYDFSSQNPSECRKRLKQLEQEYDSLRKKINVKVMNMIDRVVTKEKSLKQMLATVKKDKSKIEETIAQLDEYKKEALKRTWTKVNGDFGAIFGELLPGNTAKLEPPEGQTITEGLEVKVCLGGVWKQSLTELSGGQRSLVALSLILSLLQFKPAPMYILDEIDAALDLSHTQNIGHLFKTRFKGSQFIVVSLKEGMFNNANVLFKARFRDGTSIVERHVQKPSASKRVTDKENAADTNEAKTKPASKAKRGRKAIDAMEVEAS